MSRDWNIFRDNPAFTSVRENGMAIVTVPTGFHLFRGVIDGFGGKKDFEDVASGVVVPTKTEIEDIASEYMFFEFEHIFFSDRPTVGKYAERNPETSFTLVVAPDLQDVRKQIFSNEYTGQEHVDVIPICTIRKPTVVIEAIVQTELRFLDLTDEETLQTLISTSKDMKDLIHKLFVDEHNNKINRRSDYDGDVKFLGQCIKEKLFLKCGVRGYIGFRQPFDDTSFHSEICFAGEPGFMQNVPIKVVNTKRIVTEDNDAMTYDQLNKRCEWEKYPDAFEGLKKAQKGFVRIGQGFEKVGTCREFHRTDFRVDLNNNMCLHFQNERIEKEIRKVSGFNFQIVTIPDAFNLYKFSEKSDWNAWEKQTYYDSGAIETFCGPSNTTRLCLLDVQTDSKPRYKLEADGVSLYQQKGTTPIFCDTIHPSSCDCITDKPIKILNLEADETIIFLYDKLYIDFQDETSITSDVWVLFQEMFPDIDGYGFLSKINNRHPCRIMLPTLKVPVVPGSIQKLEIPTFGVPTRNEFIRSMQKWNHDKSLANQVVNKTQPTMLTKLHNRSVVLLHGQDRNIMGILRVDTGKGVFNKWRRVVHCDIQSKITDGIMRMLALSLR
jgi:hypothetical protein